MRRLLLAAIASTALVVPAGASADPPENFGCPPSFLPLFFIPGIPVFEDVDRNDDNRVCERFTPSGEQILIDNNVGGPN